MQEALRIGRQKEKLYAQYRRELLQSSNDERLDASLAMEYGLKYFLRLMRDCKGDMSLALAAYNAGPQRIKEYKGLPPFGETIRFRNRTLEFYREYLKRVKARNNPGGRASWGFGLLLFQVRALLKLIRPSEPYPLAVLKLEQNPVKLFGKLQVENLAP
jgi:hypothetical protein